MAVRKIISRSIADDAVLVDDLANSINTSIAAALPKAGGTMTGALTLSGAPSATGHATTKAYVDSLTAPSFAVGGTVSDMYLVELHTEFTFSLQHQEFHLLEV